MSTVMSDRRILHRSYIGRQEPKRIIIINDIKNTDKYHPPL